MQTTDRKQATGKTILVINGEIATLLLLKGILSRYYRVLLASDAASAVRLLELDGLAIDLTILDRNISHQRWLRAQVKSRRPDMRTLTTEGSCENEMIRLKVAGTSKSRSSVDFMHQVRAALKPGAGRARLAKPQELQLVAHA